MDVQGHRLNNFSVTWKGFICELGIHNQKSLSLNVQILRQVKRQPDRQDKDNMPRLFNPEAFNESQRD